MPGLSPICKEKSDFLSVALCPFSYGIGSVAIKKTSIFMGHFLNMHEELVSQNTELRGNIGIVQKSL